MADTHHKMHLHPLAQLSTFGSAVDTIRVNALKLLSYQDLKQVVGIQGTS
jgi:hypothetical protein